MQFTDSQFNILTLVITFLSTLFASSGFWLYIGKLNTMKDCRDKLLMGLAHDRIAALASKFIEQQWITPEQYENLKVYLYQPYLEMGGNGGVSRLMEEIQKLPICKNEESYNDYIRQNVR